MAVSRAIMHEWSTQAGPWPVALQEIETSGWGTTFRHTKITVGPWQQTTALGFRTVVGIAGCGAFVVVTLLVYLVCRLAIGRPARPGAGQGH